MPPTGALFIYQLYFIERHRRGAFMNNVQTQFLMDSNGKAWGSVQETGGPCSGALKGD